MVSEMVTTERRSTTRVRAYRPVRVHKPSTPEVIETLTKDLSQGGLRCLSTMLLPVASEVTVELMLGSGGEPISTRARTIWFQTIPQSEQFDIGITFVDLSGYDKRRLSAYLDRISTQA